MDLATPVGLLLAAAAVLVSMLMEGGNPVHLVQEPGPMILVFGGTLGVTLACNRLADLGAVTKATFRALLPKKLPAVKDTVEQLVAFAEVARRDGLLALEEKVKEVGDPFLKRGLELVIDGTDPDEVRHVLEADVDALRERHKVAAKYYADAGAFAPTLGIIGTVLGLIHMLENLSDPGSMGPLIAAAFVATLWGVASANLIYLPLSNKLKRISTVEVAYRELVMQGVLSIQAGAGSRAVGERLKSHLAPKQRVALEEKKSA